jgi:hypothetical protein
VIIRHAENNIAGLICFPIIEGILKIINDNPNIIINAKMFFCEKYSLAIFHQFYKVISIAF